jgi:hypothetical protein
MRKSAIIAMMVAGLARHLLAADAPVVRGTLEAVVRGSPDPAHDSTARLRIAFVQSPGVRGGDRTTTREDRTTTRGDRTTTSADRTTTAPPVAWQSAEGVRRQLDHPVSLNWSGVPLRQAIGNLARSQRVAIMLDRRTDPDQKIELVLNEVRLEEALARIATQLKLGVSRVGPVVYLGPPQTAQRLRTLVELRKQEFNRLAPPFRSALFVQRRTRWEMLAEPRELVAAAAREYRVRIVPPDDVPHDLWPAHELPAIGLAERLSLILAQFDLTFELAEEGRTLRIVPMPATAALEKTYANPNPAAVVGRLKALLQRSEIEPRDKGFVVRGPAEEHEMVESLLAGETVRRTEVTQGKKVYQLNIAMPVGRLIKQLGPMLELDVQIDETQIKRAGLSLDREVSVSVKNASEDQLLRTVLEPAGLTFERDGRTLVVRPK